MYYRRDLTESVKNFGFVGVATLTRGRGTPAIAGGAR
jgi:hypothetical protein